MTSPMVTSPSPELTALRQAWVNPFDEAPVFNRLSYWTRRARIGSAIPGFGMVPDTVVAQRLGVSVPGDGTAECAVLTADGRYAEWGAWCRDHPGNGDHWVYYERWEAGDVRHGYVCPDCRKLTQTG